MIDEGLVHPWPKEVLDALERFEQGDLIADPPAFYAGDPRFQLWRPPGGEDVLEDPEDDDGSGAVHYAFARPPEYGVITTQTCDLREQRERRLQPFFQVAPVYRAQTPERDEDEPDEPEDTYRERLLTRENIFPIPSPSGDNALWIADLRIEFPLEKGILAHRDPIQVLDESGRIRLAETLGARRARPALANEIHDITLKLISKKRSNNKRKSKAVFSKVHKVCLAIERGGRMKPLAVRLIVVTDGEATTDVCDWFAAWEDDAREPARECGITLHATGYRDATSFNLIDNAHLVNLLHL